MELMQRKLKYSEESFFKLYHLCYYFSKTNLNAEDKQLILNFKNGDENAIRHFIISALQLLQYQEMNQELIVLRALHSHELTTNKKLSTPLDRLGQSFATVFACDYIPETIRKTKLTQPVKSLTINQRKAELDLVYIMSTKSIDLNHRKILIIDDIVTTGTAVYFIIKSILHKYPDAKIDVFALAWTPTLNQQLYIQQQENKDFILNEPEVEYGNKSNRWIDEDFENDKTNVSFYA